MITFLKRFFLFLILIGMISCTHADALEFTADLNRGPCATNYTRKAPGLCSRNVQSSIYSSISTTCDLITVTEVDNVAKTVLLDFRLQVDSTNAIGIKQTTIDIFDVSDTTCLNLIRQIEAQVYEFVATPAATIAVIKVHDVNVPISNKEFRVKRNGGSGSGNIVIAIVGYTD